MGRHQRRRQFGNVALDAQLLLEQLLHVGRFDHILRTLDPATGQHLVDDMRAGLGLTVRGGRLGELGVQL